MNEDGTENVEVYLPEDLLFTLMLQAHEKNITLNQHVNDILRQELERDLGNIGTDTTTA